ncbi:MAG: hypothetical protein AABW81_04155 [Nanoarchaeota archaeon]
MANKDEQTFGKTLKDKLGGTLELDLDMNTSRYDLEIRNLKTDIKRIHKEIIEFYENKGFKHEGDLLFFKNKKKGYIVVTESYHPDLRVLRVTEDTSMLKL